MTGTTGSFDDGSEFNNYENNQNCSWLIQPTGSVIGDSITLSFSSFQLENCCDYVRVYDGTDANAPQIGNFLGTTIPADVTGTSGAMYVTFTTDVSVVYDGFEASYSYAPYMDTDGDGIQDGSEYGDNTDPLDPCDPAQSPNYAGYDAENEIWAAGDCDDDGLTNSEELEAGTDPYNPEPDLGGYVWLDNDRNGLFNPCSNGVALEESVFGFSECEVGLAGGLS